MLKSGLIRWAMCLAYDGQHFIGWQFQPHGTSVQGRLEEFLWILTRERVRVHGSGRTDAGVHAYAQVAHVDLRTSLPAERLRQGLNGLGKLELVVKNLLPARSDFHARYSASAKRYRYCIYNRPWPPVLQRRCWWIRRMLDIEAMRVAAKTLLGRHDFSAFRSADCNANSPWQTMLAIDILMSPDPAEEGMLWLEMEASGFLQHMARIICGSLIEIGLGKQPPEYALCALESRQRDQRCPTAPAQGLHLLAIRYPTELDPFCSSSLAG